MIIGYSKPHIGWKEWGSHIDHGVSLMLSKIIKSVTEVARLQSQFFARHLSDSGYRSQITFYKKDKFNGIQQPLAWPENDSKLHLL